jgi:GMP synthase-like glutamine amidotransferase
VTVGYRSHVATALIVQTELDGPAGLAADRLEHHGYDLHVVQVLDGVSTQSDVVFPDPTAFDLVVPLGSVHSVYDTAAIGSWVGREIDTVAAAHAAGVPVLGICFGAQVLCSALGGTVEPAPEYELGWVEVDSDDHDLVAPGPWFSWHGDRCVLPAGVTEVARNHVATQAFGAGSSFAVQFHPEVTGDIVRRWVSSCPPAYFAERGVDPDAVLAGFDEFGPAARANVVRLVDRFVATHAR